MTCCFCGKGIDLGLSPEPVRPDDNYTVCCHECHENIVQPAFDRERKKYGIVFKMTIELGDNIVIDPSRIDVGYVIYPDYQAREIACDNDIRNTIARHSVIHPSFRGYKSYRNAFKDWIMLYDKKESKINRFDDKPINFWAQCIGGKTVYSPVVFCHKSLLKK